MDSLGAAWRGIAVPSTFKERLDLGVVGGLLDAVACHIEDGIALVFPIENHHVSVGDVPGVPDRVVGCVRQKRQISETGHLGFTRFVARLVDGQNLDGSPAALCEVVLEVVKGAELAPTVASRGVSKVPCRDSLLKFRKLNGSIV